MTSTTTEFAKNFGARVVRYIESVTKEPLEQKAIRETFSSNFDNIFKTTLVDELIEQGKLNAAKMLAQQLRVEIKDRKKRLLEVEEVLKNEAKKSKDLLDDGDDDLFTQDLCENQSGNRKSETLVEEN